MTDTHLVQIRSTVHGQYSVKVPAPHLIKSKPVREALEKLIERDAAEKRLIIARDHAERRLLDAQTNDETRMTELYERGEGEDADPREETARAEEELKKARARMIPAQRATHKAYDEFREAVAANKGELRKAALAPANAARDKMATAHRALQLANASLEAHLGMLEMLGGDALPRYLHAEWSFGRVETGIALEALGTAVVAVDNQIRSL